ncbi:MAG: DNA integrity scanning protein DisA with diadenylate cyclase activity [Cyclobacteriaceae bacterium]|jgi:DNA integrity scanning protein DisA with diadenylate cyclase activity
MNSRTAIKLMLWMLGSVMLFHFSIILKIVPYEITWGGRLENDREMYAFETISVIINLFLYAILLIKGKYIKEVISTRIVNISLWFFLIVFGLNTIGNVIAKTTFEKFFAILTLTFSFLIWTILTKRQSTED